MSSIALSFFWPRTFYGTCLQQLLRHSTTIMIDTLYLISTLNQQLTNLEQTHIRCSLHCERWTVKGKDCASALRSFQRNYLPDGRVNETVATVKELSGLWSPGQWMELHLLWWTVFVSKCRLFVSLVWFLLVAGVIFVVFSKIYLFVPFLWRFWVSSKNSLTFCM